MSEPLTLARFQQLADAYGGVVARWPDDCRDAAMAMALQPAAQKILVDASILDDVLDTWQVTAPTALLRQGIISLAPAPTKRIVKRGRLWWASLGIGAALAGATAGTAAVAIVSPIDATSDNATSFGDVAGSET